MNTPEISPSSRSVFYPPGGMLIWIVIYLELVTFGMGMSAFAYYGAANRLSFHNDVALLNKPIAVANTVLLLTSGFFVAKAVYFLKHHQSQKTITLFNGALLTGAGFLLLKGLEYYLKGEAGIGMTYSSFFMFYWLLTGFHYIHVLVGLVILFFLRRMVLLKGSAACFEDIEAGAAFWHMCDLIWLLLFPVLYLLF